VVFEGNRCTEKKIPGGKYIKIKIQISDGAISGVTISGDFFVYPEHYIEDLEQALIGLSTDTTSVLAKLDEHRNNFPEPVDLIGIGHEDISSLLFECLSPDGPSSNCQKKA
jgi:hypothetical protein